MTASMFFGGNAKISCNACKAELVQDPETKNLVCPTPECGKGNATSPTGISLTRGPYGSVTIGPHDPDE